MFPSLEPPRFWKATFERSVALCRSPQRYAVVVNAFWDATAG